MTNQDNQLLLTQALNAYQQGDIEQAKALVRRILGTDGRNVEAWLLAINLTSNAQEQRAVLGRAKRALPDNVRILQREQELFGTDKTSIREAQARPNNVAPIGEANSNPPPAASAPRKAIGYFTPEDPNIAPFWVESRGGVQPDDIPDPSAPTAADIPVVQSIQPPSQPQLDLPPQKKPVNYNTAPTLADGVVLKRSFNSLSYLPMAIGVGALALCFLCILVATAYSGFRQQVMSNSPFAASMTAVVRLPGISPTAPINNPKQLGSVIAFVGSVGNNYQLWVINPDGSQARAITDGSTVVLPGFSWSPEGNQIAFFGARQQAPGIFLYNFTSGDFKPVISIAKEQPTMSYTVAWSPDGKYIAYMDLDGLYIVTPDGQTKQHLLTLPVTAFHHSPAWSSDSKQIAYIDNDDVFLVNADGSGLKQVTKGKVLQITSAQNLEPAAEKGFGSLLSWTPDGRLMYSVPKVDATGAVYTVVTDGTDTKVFLNQPYILEWSPDGKQLVGFRFSTKFDELGIYVLNADGTGNPRQILKFGQLGTGMSISAPVWRPNNSP